MFLPYRAKNPPEHFPYVTVGLIAINTLIFAVTSQNFLVVREDAVQQYAISHATFSLFRMFSAMFLHGSLLHLAGNMLFLWIFGASLEGRVRPLKFIAIYLLAGLGGDLLHELILGAAYPEQFSLGASGAIMGIAGAYLYVFPYSQICIAWYFWFRFGVMEWQARWVVLLYIGLDMLEAVIFAGGDGVGHFAHIGGFGVGLLSVFLLRVRRDSEEMSAVQATRAETQDYSLLSLRELETVLQHPPQNMEPVIAYCDKALGGYNGDPSRCLETLRDYIRPLTEQADAYWLAQKLLAIPLNLGGVPNVYYLRIGSRLEGALAYDMALAIYRRVYDLNPTAPETEMALYRTAQLMLNFYHNQQYAVMSLNEMLRLFPRGSQSLDAQRLLQQLQGNANQTMKL
jgi:membrane associated rhomboid family serine protease